MHFFACFALEKWFPGLLVFVSRSAANFVAVFVGTLQNPAVWSGVHVLLAALATEITAALVATKFCAAIKFCELCCCCCLSSLC